MTSIHDNHSSVTAQRAQTHRNRIGTPEAAEKPKACTRVTGGSRVVYSVDDGAAQTGLLIQRARSGAGSGVIPATSRLGATLIGMRVGQRAPLRCEDGAIMILSVLDVTTPN